MKKRVNCVLLVDDDEATNFLNTFTIKKMDFAENVVVKQNGQEALEFLETSVDGEYPQPDLIFLDVNMPVMNGWEFMEGYRKLDPNRKAKIILFMLTTSLNPDDKSKAERMNEIDGFSSKPLTKVKLEKILDDYFNIKL